MKNRLLAFENSIDGVRVSSREAVQASVATAEQSLNIGLHAVELAAAKSHEKTLERYRRAQGGSALLLIAATLVSGAALATGYPLAAAIVMLVAVILAIFKSRSRAAAFATTSARINAAFSKFKQT